MSAPQLLVSTFSIFIRRDPLSPELIARGVEAKPRNTEETHPFCSVASFVRLMPDLNNANNNYVFTCVRMTYVLSDARVVIKFIFRVKVHSLIERSTSDVLDGHPLLRPTNPWNGCG